MNGDQRFSCAPRIPPSSLPGAAAQPPDQRPEDSDLAVPRSLASGETAAWDSFFAAYVPLLRYWARRRDVAPQDTDDFLQRVYLTVYRRVHRFQPTGEAGCFCAWLATVAGSVFADQAREARRRPRASPLPQSLPDPQPSVPDEQDSQFVAWVQGRVDVEFGPRSWIIFWRSEDKKDSAAEIAADLGMTEAAVRKRASRVRRFLPSLRIELRPEHMDKMRFLVTRLRLLR